MMLYSAGGVDLEWGWSPSTDMMEILYDAHNDQSSANVDFNIYPPFNRFNRLSPLKQIEGLLYCMLVV